MALPTNQTHPRTLSGIVVSAKMNKTVVVEVERLIKHRRYGKYLRRHKRYLAHDEIGKCREGDRITIVESKPYSRRTTFRVL